MNRYALITIITFLFSINFISSAQQIINIETPADSVVIVDQSNQPKAETSQSVNIFQRLRGVLGIFFILGLAYLFSRNRKQVSLRVILSGLALQLLMAVLVLYFPAIEFIFSLIGKLFIKVLDSTETGSQFLFGKLIDVDELGFVFAFQILPTVVFFSALMSLLFYLGVVQIIVYIMAWALSKWMKMSGPESLAVTGNVFLGTTESPLLIKPYLPKLSESGMFLIMTSGLATIAGGVMAAYVGMLGGDDVESQLQFARHLITASVMAAPGAIVIAKLIFPQTENEKAYIKIPKYESGKNFLDAIAKGSYDGLKLAVNIGIMLLVFYALIALVNSGMQKLGDVSNLNVAIQNVSEGKYDSLSIEFLLGVLFSPIMWILGVPFEDLTTVGQLMGEKIVFTEFVSYSHLKNYIEQGTIQSQRSIIMATYMLCGFANFASVGIMVGGIGSLAPSQREFLSKYGMHAMLAGTLASLLSATIVGIIL